MKRFLSLELVFFLFFAAGIAYCEDSFNTGVPYYDAKNKTSFLKTKDNSETSNKINKKEKKKAKKNKEKQLSGGYYGTLPDIKQDFKYKETTSSKAPEINDTIPTEEIEAENLKPAPVNDTLFLDVIVKKDKASNYINDVQKTKFALMNLKKCIEDNGDIQRFNGCVNMVDMYSKNLAEKYENQSDSLRNSYIDIQNTNYYAKVLGNLLYDSNYYARYTPVQTGKYSKENIESKKQDLLKRINKTLFLIANET